MRKSTCSCAAEFRVIQLGSKDYQRAKTLLNRGSHPTFIGRDLVARYTRNGGAFIFTFRGEDVAVAIVNPARNVLMVLNVAPEHRRHGLGAAMLRYLQCNFARVVESAVPFFAANAYTAIGAMKKGRALNTQIMVLSGLLTLAGRVAKCLTPKAE